MKLLELLQIMVVPRKGWDVVSSKRKRGLLACAVGGRGNISWLLGSEAGRDRSYILCEAERENCCAVSEQNSTVRVGNPGR